MKVRFKRGDLVLVTVMLIIGGAGWLTIRLVRSNNSPTYVQIITSDQKFEITLDDTLLVIPGPLGETEVRIKDGKVWVIKASCPQKLCARQGKIERSGQSIVCLPNRIVVTIQGKSKLDAITY